MIGMSFVLALVIALLGGLGGVILIGQRQKQGHEERMLERDGDPDGVRRLAEAVESLQEQMSDLSDRMDFTERLLEAPKGDDDQAGPG